MIHQRNDETPDFKAAAAEFRKADWQELNSAVFIRMEPPRPCQACQRTACYGSYRADSLYRMCKFCGFYQKVNETSTYLVPNAHSCAEAEACRILDELYIEWTKPNEVTRECESCHLEYSIKSYVVPRPYARAEHGWWRIPQGMDLKDSIAFWKAQGFKDERPYL